MRIPLGLVLPPAAAVLALPFPAAAARFGDAFWKHWGDGRAEVATYDLTYPRYGEPRRGVAVAVFVTETFSEDARVKADPGTHPSSDEFPVMKLNLVQDFPTGIYDYHLMTSAFAGLSEHGGRTEGAVAKVSFSSQEWCGQVWHELVPEARSVRYVSHSYFDGEADERVELDWPADGVAEDALLLWARGLASPVLDPGESRRVRLLSALEISRLGHAPPEWARATLARANETSSIDVPAGRFEVVRLEVEIEAGVARRSYPPRAAAGPRPVRRWTFWVEAAAPHRIVRWERAGGARAELLASRRLPYWEMNAPGFEQRLSEIGLEPRPRRTP